MDANIALVIVAAINLAGLFVTGGFAYMAQRQSKANANTLRDTNANVQKIETATNSIVEKLFVAKSEAAHSAGKEEGRVEGEQKAAILAAEQKEPPK